MASIPHEPSSLRPGPGGVSTARKLAALRDPATYPVPPRRIEAVSTHMAWVFLAGERAYKMKKPVRTPVLDFTTLASRRRDGEREIALNRALAGSIYRGLTPLAMAPEGTLHLGGSGPAVEWLVAMERLPAGESLDARIAAQTLVRRDVERAIEWLVRFYDRLDAEPLSGEAYCQRLYAQIGKARRELSRRTYQLPGELVERAAAGRLHHLERERDRLAERARRGHIVDAHGDLRPEHMFLRPLPVIIDCLEFRRELRLLDPISELAFLSLECERLGAAWVGDVAFATYRARSGDEAPAQLVNFYRSTHALSRAVVAIWHLDDPQRRDGARFRKKALHYLELADRSAAGAQSFRR